jgi:hypothetical protein
VSHASDIDWEHLARLVHAAAERWRDMAETLWEELQEWHHDECPTHAIEGCTCHRILAVMWDELTNAADWSEDDPQCDNPYCDDGIIRQDNGRMVGYCQVDGGTTPESPPSPAGAS